MGGEGGGRASCTIGIVGARAQGDSHFEQADGRVRVDVQIQSGEHVWARLGGVAGGRGVGIYSIPLAGSEVLVALPDGAVDGEAVLLATLDTGEVPDGLTAGGTTVIAVPAGEQVLVHDGAAGDAKALATKEDVDNHTHDLEAMKVVTTASAGTWDVIRDPAAPPLPPKPTKKPAAVAGTSVLKAK